jgi:hypothetical protein
VDVLGEKFNITLEEKTKRVKREMTEFERQSKAEGWRKSDPYDLEPSGLLCLRILDGRWMRYELADRQTHVLEDRLNRFVSKLLEKAFEGKRRRAEREKEQLAWQEADRLRREEETRAAKEQEKIEQWDQWMAAWKRTQDVRAFAAAIREALAPIEEGSKPAEWLVWAEAYAERIDPLRPVPEGRS